MNIKTITGLMLLLPACITAANAQSSSPAKKTKGLIPSDTLVHIGSSQVLIDQLPVKGKIIKETENKLLGVTELLLNNGVRVLLKPTTFKDDQILFNAFSAGGVSLYDDSDYQSAINASGAVGGVGRFDTKTLVGMFAGKQVNVSPFISEYFEGVNGFASRRDLEPALQLVYLCFTSPRSDTASFKEAMINLKSNIANRSASPDNVFADTMIAVLGNYHYRRSAPSLEKLGQISPVRAMEIYKERFADASDFTFVFTGSFKLDSIKPLLEQYLGSLPSIHRKEQGKDAGIRIPQGQISKTVYKGTEDKATAVLVYNGKHNGDIKGHLYLSALREILVLRLTDRLRDNEGNVYTPNVALGYSRFPDSVYTLQISFACAPENVEKLIAAAKEEVSRLVNDGPLETDLQKYKADASRIRESALKTNEYWQTYMTSSAQNETDPEYIFNALKLIDQLTVNDLKQTAQKYLNGENLIRFVLLPEMPKYSLISGI